MKKLFIIAIVSLLCLCVFALSETQLLFDGYMLQSTEREDVSIIISISRFNKWIGRLSGKMEIIVHTGNNSYNYVISNSTFNSSSEYNLTTAYRFYGEAEYEHGYVYYDNTLLNLIFITSERHVYAANEKFISIVSNVIK